MKEERDKAVLEVFTVLEGVSGENVLFIKILKHFCVKGHYKENENQNNNQKKKTENENKST